MAEPARTGHTGHPARPSRRRLPFTRSAAALAALYLVLLHAAITPLHERGAAQGVTAPLCGFGDVLEAPARGILARFGIRGRRHPNLVDHAFLVVASAALAWAAAAVLAGILGRTRQEDPRAATRLSRRLFLRAGTAGACAAAGGLLGWSLLLEPRRLVVSRRAVRIRELHPALHGLRAVHLTDIHMGPWISIEQVREAVRVANACDPDLVLLTGDYVHRSAAYVRPAVGALAELEPRIGALAVLGNHDWYEDPTGELLREAFERAGVPLIDNGRVFVTPERRLAASASEGLCVAGIGDLWEDEVNFQRALGGVPADVPRLLLSHNPDAAEEPELRRGGFRVDLMLSGHTHGGQIRVPGLGTPIVPSRFGQKYAHGLVQGPACPVLVSSGVGMTVLPLRLGVPPEITVLELRGA
ncbi:MAG: metallophosphoesterase [Planctomycetes bacterium]|nr:metallophosphoesterase [Planctomycetota bacterium]